MIHHYLDLLLFGHPDQFFGFLYARCKRFFDKDMLAVFDSFLASSTCVKTDSPHAMIPLWKNIYQCAGYKSRGRR